MRFRFLAAVILFVAFNYALAWLYLDKRVDGDLELENQTVISTYELAPECDVLLLGSSLVERPFTAAPPKIADLKIKSLACWSAMISDQFVLLNEVVRPIPPLVVLGVGPRDFSDTRWIHPDQTLIFRTQVSLSVVPNYWFLFGGDVNNKLEFFANRLFPLYRNRRKTQKFVFARFVPALHGDVPVSLQVADDETISVQFQCFRKLLESIKNKGGKVLVANMPVTGNGVRMLPPHFYSNYLSRVKRACDDSGVQFLDSNTLKFLDNADFADVIHLNENGARKWDGMLNAAIVNALH